MSKWDKTVPYEIKTSTNWSEEILDISNGENVVRENILKDKDVFLLSSCFSAEESLKLISAAEALGFGRTSYRKSYRGNYRLITTDMSLAEALWSRIHTLVPTEVEEDGFMWEAVGLNECFRLSKYTDGDVFGTHVDTCFIRNSCEKSMYTVNMYLNGGPDQFHQGSTRFYSSRRLAPECCVTPVAGMALVFRQPPFAHYEHDGEIVKGGCKYLIRTDIMYRKKEYDEVKRAA